MSTRKRSETPRAARVGGALALGVGLLLAPAPAPAQGPGDFVPTDAVTVVVLEREVRAIVSGRGQVTAELEGDEELLWSGAQGVVGLAVTDRRVLAISPASSGWQELRQPLADSDIGPPRLGHEVALVLTRWRMLAFDGQRGRWARYDFSPGEQVLARAVDTAVAVVATNRHVLGLRAGSGRIESQRLRVHEDFVRLQADGRVAVVTTSKRLLFLDGIWRDERLPIN